MKMKTKLFTALILTGCFAVSAQNEQSAFQKRVEQAQQRMQQQQFTVDPATGAPIPVEDKLKRFNLRFPGGTPAEFIEAIDEQANMNVNVIIPPEFANEPLPPLEVYDVRLPQLFEAGIVAGTRLTNVVSLSTYGRNGPPKYVSAKVSQGFQTTDQPPTDNSIWNFFVERPNSPPPIEYKENEYVRVYQLGRLLGSYSIEDITTAIKTTWEMLDSKTKPEMKFHAETKLLVAKGTEEQLRMIETVTQQLEMGVRTAIDDSNSQFSGPNRMKPGQPIRPKGIPEVFDNRP